MTAPDPLTLACLEYALAEGAYLDFEKARKRMRLSRDDLAEDHERLLTDWQAASVKLGRLARTLGRQRLSALGSVIGAVADPEALAEVVRQEEAA